MTPENGIKAETRFTTLSRREHLPDEIARLLSDEIASGNLGPGDRLPTEASLSSSFGVSRAVVREAIARLKHEGLVETRQGLGAFVAANPTGQSFRIESDRLIDPDDLRHVLELRLHVEMGAAMLAAERHSDAQLARIRGALRDIADAIAVDADGVPADTEFHHAIAEAANNPYYRDFMVFLADRMRQSIAAARSNTARFQWTPKVQAEHERICTAIGSRDPEEAREAVRAHLVNAARRLGVPISAGATPTLSSTK